MYLILFSWHSALLSNAIFSAHNPLLLLSVSHAITSLGGVWSKAGDVEREKEETELHAHTHTHTCFPGCLFIPVHTEVRGHLCQ